MTETTSAVFTKSLAGFSAKEQVLSQTSSPAKTRELNTIEDDDPRAAFDPHPEATDQKNIEEEEEKEAERIAEEEKKKANKDQSEYQMFFHENVYNKDNGEFK